jgi:hypothetical protein
MPSKSNPKPSQPKTQTAPPPPQPERQKGVTKLQTIIELLSRAEGADVAALVSATGWQAHSIRGVMAGQLKKKGLLVQSEKMGGRRVYRLPKTAEA